MATVTVACAIPGGLQLVGTTGWGPYQNEQIVLNGPERVPSQGAGVWRVPGDWGLTEIDADQWAGWAAVHPELISQPGDGGCWVVE